MTGLPGKDHDPSGEAVQSLAEGLFDALRRETSDSVGTTREAYSERESVALDIIEEKAKALGLETERDAAANLVVTLLGRDPSLPFLACGSHLDSVPQGGNYDGAAGVVAGLDIVAGFIERGITPNRTVKVFALRGEESSRFGRAYMGSSALFGLLTPADLSAKDQATGRTLLECMADVGVDVERVRDGKPLLDAKSVAAWIELHIEQGPVLVSSDTPIAIVNGIRGNLRHRSVQCVGEAGHSGAVPRALRRDAVFATAELIMRLDAHWRSFQDSGQDLAVTCGILGTEPSEHAIARIPGRVNFSLDIRSLNARTLESFYKIFLGECRSIEQERGVQFNPDRRIETVPAHLDAEWIKRLERAARRLSLPFLTIPSGAGHDAAVFANAGVPSAMIFVRNQHGSHNPREAMEIDDFVKAVAVMGAAIVEAAD